GCGGRSGRAAELPPRPRGGRIRRRACRRGRHAWGPTLAGRGAGRRLALEEVEDVPRHRAVALVEVGVATAVARGGDEPSALHVEEATQEAGGHPRLAPRVGRAATAIASIVTLCNEIFGHLILPPAGTRQSP